MSDLNDDIPEWSADEETEETLVDKFIRKGQLVQDGKPQLQWIFTRNGRQLLIERRMYESVKRGRDGL